MADLAQRPRHTVSDFMALPEGTRAELIRGELTIMSPAPKVPHQVAAQNLLSELRTWGRAGSRGRVLMAPMDVHLPSGDIVEPDVILVASGGAAELRDWVYGVPALLVEVLSPSHPERDRRLKGEVYAENGVPEYWIVDPEAQTLEVLRLDGGSYATHARFAGEDVVTSPSLSGFALPLPEVWVP